MSKHILEDYQSPLSTQMGKCFPGQRTVYRGFDLHADLKDMEWVELYVFGITGRRFSKSHIRLLNTLWTCTSYPDVRLWNNRVAALAASGRSTPTLAISAAMAVTDAKVYGWQPTIAITDFLIRALNEIDKGINLEEIIEHELSRYQHIGGYGRPVATLEQDERIPVVIAKMREEEISDGRYLQLAFQIEQHLIKLGRPLRMNYVPVLAAVLLDLGFTLRECYLFVQPCVMAGMPPCYIEALDRPEGGTFALRCSDIQYLGSARRKWNE